MPPIILTDIDDYNQVRAYLGLDPIDFTDDSIAGLLFLGAAELVIKKLVNAAAVITAGLSPTVAQIMDPAGPLAPATEDDKTALRIATAIYIAFQFTPSSTNAINTSVTVGKQTVDRGGIGVQWQEQRGIAFSDVGMYLSLITGWPEQSQSVLELSGPTSSGAAPDTTSGFWLAGR